MGDYIFTDEKFVRSLSSEHKNVFQRIYDEIKYLVRSATAGSAEARELEKIKKIFDKVYSESPTAEKNTANGGVRYSISPTLETQLDAVLNGTFDASKNEVYLGETSNFMTSVIGAESLSLYMPASKAYSAMVTEEEYQKNPYYTEQDNYHGIGKKDLIEILEKSEAPIAAFAAPPDVDGNKRNNRIVLVTDKIIKDLQTGKDGYAVVVEEVNSLARKGGKRVKANKTITVYPRTQLALDVKEAFASGRILDINKKGEQFLAGGRGSNPQAAIQETVLKNNIANFWANVKWENQKNKKTSSSVPQGLTPMQAAFAKAGYTDQSGHKQYTQKKRKNSLSPGEISIAPPVDGYNVRGEDIMLAPKVEEDAEIDIAPPVEAEPEISIAPKVESEKSKSVEADEFTEKTLNSFGVERIGDYIHVQRQVFDTLLNEGFFTNTDTRSRTDVNEETGMVIETNKSSICETFNLSNYERLGKFKKVAKLATVRMIPEAIQKGKLISDNVPNQYENSTNKTFAYVSYDTEINGIPVTIKLDVKKTPHKNKLWVHSIVTEKIAPV